MPLFCSGSSLTSFKFRALLQRALVCFVTLVAVTDSALAVDYVSVAENAAILYDAPSLKAKKIFVASRFLPLEQVVVLDNWVKVRDSSGGLSWIEKRALSSKRYVMVTTPLANVHLTPEETSAIIINAKQNVALERLESTGTGWIKIRHPDGPTGYLKTAEVWGD
jgi:SH3-like domain-containing protein